MNKPYRIKIVNECFFPTYVIEFEECSILSFGEVSAADAVCAALNGAYELGYSQAKTDFNILGPEVFKI